MPHPPPLKPPHPPNSPPPRAILPSNHNPIPTPLFVGPLLRHVTCRLATGITQVHIIDTYFGGDKSRWVYAYPWMLKYLDERYSNIVGHQGLSRFVDDFPRFKRAIEEYVQRDHQRELVDGTMTIVPGINFLPWDVFAFIDDSIDRISRRRRERGGEAGDACTRPLCRRLQGRNWGENPIFAPVSPPKMGETPPPENRGENGGCPSVAGDVIPPPTPQNCPQKNNLNPLYSDSGRAGVSITHATTTVTMTPPITTAS